MYVTGMESPLIVNCGWVLKEEEMSHSGTQSWAKIWVLEKSDEGES